ncbi:hypothetical protein MASR2M15_17860 [Anaerolineales bacterium]
MSVILLVDDDPAYLYILKTFLNDNGFQTITLNRGEDVLTTARTYKPDIIFLDDWLPGMSGGQICAALKQSADLAHIPVILGSAEFRINHHQYSLATQANHIIEKNLKLAELKKLIELLILESNSEV